MEQPARCCILSWEMIRPKRICVRILDKLMHDPFNERNLRDVINSCPKIRSSAPAGKAAIPDVSNSLKRQS